MRRIAARRSFTVFLFTLTAALISYVPAQAQSGPLGVIVRVNDASRVNQLAGKYGLNVQFTIPVGTGAAFLIKGVSAVQAHQILQNEPSVVFVEQDNTVPLDVDGGETVLPLDDDSGDGGETVLPLDDGDGGETVLPLSSPGQFISQLMGQQSLPTQQLSTIASAFSKIGNMVYPSPRLIIQPSFGQIGLYQAITHATGRNVVIADLDTGADTCHPTLRGVVTYTFITGAAANAPENCPTAATQIVPGYGHGTRVAGLLRFVAPAATIWSMRVFDNTGTAQISAIHAAIIYAVNNGADVINMSFGTSTYSQTLADAISYAQSRGVVLVAAGGNGNTSPLMYPAQLPGVDGVVAVTGTDTKAPFSNYGFGADIAAPGVGLWTAYPGNQMAKVSGTSYASPLVAAEAALVIDSYQQNFRGQPNANFVNRNINNGVQQIDWLNPGYRGQLGSGRIYIPSALFGGWWGN
jgi:Subtilase family